MHTYNCDMKGLRNDMKDTINTLILAFRVPLVRHPASSGMASVLLKQQHGHTRSTCGGLHWNRKGILLHMRSTSWQDASIACETNACAQVSLLRTTVLVCCSVQPLQHCSTPLESGPSVLALPSCEPRSSWFWWLVLYGGFFYTYNCSIVLPISSPSRVATVI
jgi:hypothetical protein